MGWATRLGLHMGWLAALAIVGLVIATSLVETELVSKHMRGGDDGPPSWAKSAVAGFHVAVMVCAFLASFFIAAAKQTVQTMLHRATWRPRIMMLREKVADGRLSPAPFGELEAASEHVAAGGALRVTRQIAQAFVLMPIAYLIVLILLGRTVANNRGGMTVLLEGTKQNGTPLIISGIIMLAMLVAGIVALVASRGDHRKERASLAELETRLLHEAGGHGAKS